MSKRCINTKCENNKTMYIDGCSLWAEGYLHECDDYLVREKVKVEIPHEGRTGIDILSDWVKHQFELDNNPWIHVHDIQNTIEAIQKELKG